VTSMRHAPFWIAMQSLAHTLPYDGAVIGDTMSGGPLPTHRWANLAIPALVLDGGASPQMMHDGAQALADLLPTVQRRTLPGQTHAVDVEVLARALNDFFHA